MKGGIMIVLYLLYSLMDIVSLQRITTRTLYFLRTFYICYYSATVGITVDEFWDNQNVTRYIIEVHIINLVNYRLAVHQLFDKIIFN